MTTLIITLFTKCGRVCCFETAKQPFKPLALRTIRTTIIFLFFVLSPLIAFSQFSYISAGAGQVQIERTYAIDWTIGYDIFASTWELPAFAGSEVSELSVFPNPFSNAFFIQLPITFQQKNIHIQIKDPLNRVVWSVVRQRAGTRERLSLPSIPDGMYSLQISIPEESAAHSVQIMKVSSDLK